jgi:hypothetical protein
MVELWVWPRMMILGIDCDLFYADLVDHTYCEHGKHSIEKKKKKKLWINDADFREMDVPSNLNSA